MNMSMDKPIALNRAEGTRGPQVEKCKNECEKHVARVSAKKDVKKIILNVVRGYLFDLAQPSFFFWFFGWGNDPLCDDPISPSQNLGCLRM